MAGDEIGFTSTSDMFEQLSSVPNTIAVVGLVKPDEDASDSFHFSFSGCGAWVTVPGGMVERFQPLGKARCGDHQHDLVRLHLKRPDQGHAVALADLLAQRHKPDLWTKSGATVFGDSDGPHCPPGTRYDSASGHCLPI